MNEKSLGEKIATAEVYKSNISLLEQQEEFLKSALDDFMAAKETLKNYSNSENGDDILVPVGGNTFIFAKVSDSKKVLRGVGNELVLEQNMETALERITAHIEEIGDSMQKVSSKVVDLQRKHHALSAEIQKEYAQFEQGAQG